MPLLYIAPDNMCTPLKLNMKRVQDYFNANGWTIVTNPERADVILCGTCVGFENLEKESLNRLKDLSRHGKKVFAMGCLVNFNPSGLNEVHKGPALRSWEFEKIASLIKNPDIDYKDISESSIFRSKEDYRLYDLRKRYVGITSGCSFACTYCPHRIGYGDLRSRSIDDIVEQIGKMKSEEVDIIVLTGLETALYGTDIGTTFPELLRRVLSIDMSFDVHIAQFNPEGVLRYQEDLLLLFSNGRVTDIQIPVETTSKRLLRMMNRPLHTELVGNIVAKIKENNSKAIFRTDLLIGFPTETIEELTESLRFAADNFDEISIYEFEMKRGAPVEKMGVELFSKEELERRINYSVRYIEDRNKMAHTGAQRDSLMIELEERRELMRAARWRCR